MRDSTRSGRSGQPAKSKAPVVSDNRKPAKPYPDFPLTPRLDGRWCKKIRGTVPAIPGGRFFREETDGFGPGTS